MKLLAIDMDGTCLDPHSRITDSTLEALRMAPIQHSYSSHHRSGFILSASSTY